MAAQRRWREKVKGTAEYKKKERERKRRHREKVRLLGKRDVITEKKKKVRRFVRDASRTTIPRMIIQEMDRDKKRAVGKLTKEIKRLKVDIEEYGKKTEWKGRTMRGMERDLASVRNRLAFEKQKKAPKPKTIHAYFRNLGVLYRKIHGGEMDGDIRWLDDYDGVVKWIEESDSMSDGTKSTVVNSITSILGRVGVSEDVYLKYSRLNIRLARERKEWAAQNKLPVHKQYIPTWDKIMGKLFGLKLWKRYLYDYKKPTKEDTDDLGLDGAHVTFQKALCYVYTLFPPRRLEDFQFMRIVSDRTKAKDKKFNYILSTGAWSAKFIFYKFKTSKKYGRQEFDVPRILRRYLASYIQSNGLKNGDLLFGQFKYKRPTANYRNFTLKVKDAFWETTGLGAENKGLTVNDLRHSYISFLLFFGDNKPRLTLHDRRKIAEAMAHSTGMQELYAKIDLGGK